MAEAKATNMKVSGTGGAGTNGQPATYMSNDYERTGDAGNMELQTSAMMNKSGVNVSPTPMGALRATPATQNAPLTRLDAPTNEPNVPVSDGAALGDGRDGSALVSSTMLAAQNDQDVAKLAAFLPVYAQIAESPNATNATRNFYRYLRTIIG